MSLPAREFFPLLPPGTQELLYLALLVNLVFFLFALRSKIKFYGIPVRDFTRIMLEGVTTRWKPLVNDYLIQRRTIEKKFPGLMHSAIYSGTIILFIGTSLVFLDFDILRFFGIQLLQGEFYLGYETVLDLFGLIFLFGLSLGIFRRFILRSPSRRIKWDDGFIFFGLFFVGISGFILEGFRLVLRPVPWESSSFVGSSIAFYLADFPGEDILRLSYVALWWVHALVAFALLSSLPYTKLGHVFGSWANSIMREPRPMGKLSTPFQIKELMEQENFDLKVGLTNSADLNWKQKMTLESCVDCGRCQDVCPANAAGRDLSPRLVIQDLSKMVRSDYSNGTNSSVLQSAIREDEAWSCTTCNACVQVCPVEINQLDFIIDLRRGLVADNKIDEKKRAFLTSIDASYNPFGLPATERTEWLEKENVPTIETKPDAEYLYWIGCQSSYDARSREVVRAMISIMRKAQISFAILGKTEKCSGEPVRRLGEEGRFQQLALENIEVMQQHGIRKIVTHCAHCFNTIKNEYPEFGGQFEVIHHSEFLMKLLGEGKIRVKGQPESTITYHDPCNLGRGNQIYDPPRKVLESINGFKNVEMEQSRENGFCCGAGGANPFYTVPEKVKISEIRVGHAESTGAKVLAVACPFCLSMFDDALKGKNSTNMKVKDIAEIINDSME